MSSEEPTGNPLRKTEADAIDEKRWIGKTDDVVLSAFQKDKWFYRMIAVSLGLSLLIGVGGSIYLTAFDKEIPDFLIAIGSGIVGAFAGAIAVTTNTTKP